MKGTGRALALLLGLTLSATSATLFTTQTASYAFSPGGFPVTLPGTIARGAIAAAQTVLPAAGTAGAAVVGVGAAGLAAGGAVGTAGVCLFTSLPCLLPDWGQAPNVRPNSDQPVVSPGSFTAAYSSGGVLRTQYAFAFVGPGTPGQLLYDVSVIRQTSFDGMYVGPQCSNTAGVNWTSISFSTAQVGQTIRRTVNQPQAGCVVSGGVWRGDSPNATGANAGTFVWNPPVGGGAAPDPARWAQAFRECAKNLNTSSPEFLRLVGQAVTYREAMEAGTRPALPVPPCPSDFPVPFRFGVGSGVGQAPPARSEPLSQPAPSTTRGLPPIGYPAPTTYPECPLPGTCPVGRPTPGGTPLLPLPSPPNPDGSPARNPDGTPKTEPLPVPAPGAAPCAWGPYAVPEANCTGPDSAEAPQPEPSTAAETGTDPAPAPQTDPEGCLSRSVAWNPITWVFGPVKCALKWAFQISPATQAKWSQAGQLARTKPPISLVAGGAGSAFAAPFGAIGQNCPDWTVTVGAFSENVVCGKSYTERLHDWRTLTGSALLALAVMPFLWRVWHAGIPVLNVQPHR